MSKTASFERTQTLAPWWRKKSERPRRMPAGTARRGKRKRMRQYCRAACGEVLVTRSPVGVEEEGAAFIGSVFEIMGDVGIILVRNGPATGY
jgi:hypothetical protein